MRQKFGDTSRISSENENAMKAFDSSISSILTLCVSTKCRAGFEFCLVDSSQVQRLQNIFKASL